MLETCEHIVLSLARELVRVLDLSQDKLDITDDPSSVRWTDSNNARANNFP
jgi:hypothetical protein